jgi:hypothetical protein
MDGSVLQLLRSAHCEPLPASPTGAAAHGHLVYIGDENGCLTVYKRQVNCELI